MGPQADILLIDAGNTRVKWGLLGVEGIGATGALPTAQSEQLAKAWKDLHAPQAALASNVAGPRVQADLETACAGRGIALQLIRAQASQLGVVNGYRDPAQLGSDRWAALIGAHHAEKGHKVVINAGTALTVDGLHADGRFLGGLILPGPRLMRQSLDRGTAGLRLTEGEFHDFPESTPDAITTGSLMACSGAIERFVNVMMEQGANPDVIVLSGGAADEMAPHLPMAYVIRENLVLEGLALIARAA